MLLLTVYRVAATFVCTQVFGVRFNLSFLLTVCCALLLHLFRQVFVSSFAFCVPIASLPLVAVAFCTQMFALRFLFCVYVDGLPRAVVAFLHTMACLELHILCSCWQFIPLWACIVVDKCEHVYLKFRILCLC